MRRSIPTIALVGAGLLFAACGGGDSVSENLAEELIEQQGGGDVDIDSEDGSVNIDTDEGSFSVDEDGNVDIETDDGSFSAQSGSELPDDFPDDIPLPDGLEIQQTSQQATEDGASFSVSGHVDGDPADVLEDVVAQFEDEGWEVVSQSNTNTDDGYFGSAQFSDGVNTVLINVLDDPISGEGTTVSIIVAPEG